MKTNKQHPITGSRILHRLVIVGIAIAACVIGDRTCAVDAIQFTSLYSFMGPDEDDPLGALTKGPDGNFYGTTSGGYAGKGAIYKITSDGVLTFIYSFTGGTDSSQPVGKLALATDGNFYGVTNDGQRATFFRVTPAGKLTTLCDFSTIGAYPKEGVIQAADGNFYGTAYGGPFPYNGVIYKITPAGELTTLHEFNGTDGWKPEGRLVQGTDGNLYGTTSESYADPGSNNYYGTVFKVTPAGAFTMLHKFSADDGQHPHGTLIQAKDGTFYGTTVDGPSGHAGTVFSITSSGTFKSIYSFAGEVGELDGCWPYAGLLEGTDGNFYGTTAGCGEGGWGTIFKITPAGMLTTLYSFHGTDGFYPVSELIENDDGYFYGTTEDGGSTFPSNDQDGTVFKFTLANTPPTPTPNAFQSTLGNISTRLRVETGDNVLIGGFIINGSAAKKVLIRAIGPSLLAQNVPSPLMDPTISLHSTTAEIDSNDDWQSHPNANQIPSNLQPGDPRESAILTTLQPGQYTAIISGKGGTIGVALVEVYDMDTAATSELANISTRGLVQTGDFVMIGGFVPAGTGNIQVLIRAIGPSLAGALANPLPDPTVRVFNSNGAVIGSNDNWRDSQEAQIQATGNAPTNNLESAILMTLAPGTGYTAIVSDKNGASGVGLVEVFKIQ